MRQRAKRRNPAIPKVSITIPADVLRAVDARAKRNRSNRSHTITRILLEQLTDHELQPCASC